MKQKRISLLIWATLVAAGWFIASQSWYLTVFEEKTYELTGDKAFVSISSWLWLNLITIVAVLVFQKRTATAIAIASAVITAITAGSIAITLFSTAPDTVADAIAKQTGVTADFDTESTVWGFGFVLIAGLVFAAQLLSAVASAKAPLRPKKFDRKHEADDPISLWESQG